jgi:hypothetical protein
MIARASAVAVALATSFAPGAAWAVEKEHHLGAGPGFTVLTIDQKPTNDVGASLFVDYSYGITDAFNFLAEGTTSLVALDERPQPGVNDTHPAMVSSLAVGASYIFDVLRWVPHAGALVGGYVLNGGSLDHTLILPGAQVGAGLDYRITPQLSVGVIGREHILFSRLTTYPFFLTVFARAEFSWGR